MAQNDLNAGILPQEDNNKLAMWIFLGGEVVFFTTLILTYILFRLENPSAYADFKAHLSIPLIGLNTFILISSSYMVVRSLEAIQDGQPRSLGSRLLAVAGLGLLFLAGQAFEWTTLFQSGISFNSLFGTAFFSITGVHGTHVFVGVIWCLIVFFGARHGAYTREDYGGVEQFGLYWHFVDIVWIVLFTLFYLI